MIKKLLEGIKFGNREKSLVLSNSDDYNIGIEYEFNPLGSSQLEFEDIVDVDGDPDDVIRQMNDFVDERGQDFDDTYTHVLANELDSHGFGEPEPMGYWITVYYDFIAKISEVIVNMERPDTETEDMFGNEMTRAYVDTIFKILEDDENDIELKVLNNLVSVLPNHSDEDVIFLTQLVDLYFEGDLFENDSAKLNDFNVSLGLFSEIHSDLFSGDDERIDSEKLQEGMNEFIKHVQTTSLSEYYLNSNTRFTMDEDRGVHPHYDYDLDEYITYVEHYGVIPDVQESLIQTFRSDIEEGAFSGGFGQSIDEDDLRDAVSHIIDIIDEHDEMKEVITEKMSVKQAIQNIKSMFNYLNDHEVASYAGMHISISTNVHDLDDFNLIKFITIMDIPHILEYFPSRSMVDDLYSRVATNIERRLGEKLLESIDSNDSLTQFVYTIEEMLSNSDLEDTKYQSINFGDYHVLGGRIELRFFGGENYHERYDEVLTMMLRALYLLNFAYTDEHNKDYYKKIAKTINNVIKSKTSFSLSYLYKTLVEFDNKYGLKDQIKKWPNSDKEFKDDLEKYFKKDFDQVMMILINARR